GLPGRVLASGKPVWVSDVTLDRNFPRAKLVKNLGIKAGFAFPVLEGQKVVSVLEFFSTEAMEPAKIILEALSNFAVQVGRVSERKKAEEEIKRYRDHLEKEVDKRTQELDFQKNTLDEHAIVSATDSNGNITYANDKFCAISGYKRDEVMGQNHRIIKSDEHPPEFYRDMWNTISNGKVWHGELKNKKKNGDYY
ncbi:MAG: PAS domain S-box protein, partial [Candidatus Pacebacteria bacterium]|nr:PAS domain S-box protein [Candidatus Paceibacterota bacterium]